MVNLLPEPIKAGERDEGQNPSFSAVEPQNDETKANDLKAEANNAFGNVEILLRRHNATGEGKEQLLREISRLRKAVNDSK